ncbi:NRM1-like protein [Colletotrichum tofieldiae]|nr:NRM1-like protein [Colletotrichum tofieldiae]
MSSPWKQQPEEVADKVLKRVEVSKIARRLQNRLALAQFKTKHGWEDLTFDTIEPKYEEEMRRKRLCEGDHLRPTISYENPHELSVEGSPLLRRHRLEQWSTGHRKRTYMASFEYPSSSPSKRYRSSPTPVKSLHSHTSWKESHQLAQSSPIKPRRQQHFTTSTGPDVSFFQGARRLADDLVSPNFAANSDDEDDLLPAQSFRANNIRSSPPTTPPMRNRAIPNRRTRDRGTIGEPPVKSGEEGADLLLYLAASPSPAVPSTKTRMEPPSTPPSKIGRDMTLPSSHMTTPGGGNMFPNTPGQGFDFAEFVNITPSPAQKAWKTPVALSSARTPVSLARRRLTFDEPLA